MNLHLEKSETYIKLRTINWIHNPHNFTDTKIWANEVKFINPFKDKLLQKMRIQKSTPKTFKPKDYSEILP